MALFRFLRRVEKEGKIEKSQKNSTLVGFAASGKRRGKGETVDLPTTAAHAQDNVWNGGNW